MDILNFLKKILHQISVDKKDLIIFFICLILVFLFRILISFLKKKFKLSNLITKSSNYIIILFFLEYLKPKISELWFLRFLYCIEIILIFLIVKLLLVDYYLKDYLVSKKNKKINHIIIDIIKFIIAIFFILIFLREVLNLNLVTILTPSAILTAIVGLSLKDTIGNLISGILIQIEKPFDIGDWIQVGELIGCVKEITWRYTKIKTILNVYIIIPNNTISSDNIINYSKPTKEFELSLEIGVDYEVPPIKVKRAIYEILGKNKYVMQNKPKAVLLKEYGSSSINYKILFSIKDYSFKRYATDEIYSAIWYQFKKYGIVIPFPIRTLVFKKGEDKKDIGWIIEALRKNSLFKDARKDVLDTLATYGNVLEFLPGEEVVKEGETGTTMFIIISGEFEVVRKNKKIAILRPGDFFGEVALISDEKRNATVISRSTGNVIEIDRMLFQLALERDRILKNEVYKKFHERIEKRFDKEITKEEKEKKSTLFENLKRFFGL